MNRPRVETGTGRAADDAAARRGGAHEPLTIRRDSFYRLEWLVLLTCLAAVILVYPLRLQDAWLGELYRWWDRSDGFWSRWTHAQFGAYLSFFYSPLILKGVIAGVGAFIFCGLALARGLLGPHLRCGTIVERPQSPWAWCSVALLLGWVLASGLWSPTPAQARDAAWFVAPFGLLLFLLLRRGLLRQEARWLAIALVSLGAIVMAVMLMQALPGLSELTFRVMTRFDDFRNLYGSLMGHNTAVASLLLMTLFPALALAAGARTRRRRLALGLYLVALVYGLIVTQSRAIWLIGPPLIVGQFVALLRATRSERQRRRLRGLPTLLLAIAALAILTQVIRKPWNPFFVRAYTLSERLRDLGPDALRRESRLRLNVIGATLVPDRPLLGHGLAAFQYVYPRRQGEYFSRHPESRLGRTEKRSHMAHNEYLQVAIEQGLIGLALLIAVLAEVARRGGRRGRRLRGRSRLLHEAFGWSSLGFLLHAAVDFPFHIPQLLVPGLLCVAAWSGTGGLIRRVGGDDPGRALPAGRSNFRWPAFARLLATMLLFFAVPLAGLPLVRRLQADVAYNEGGAYLTRYDLFGQSWPPEEALANFELAAQSLREALRLQPSHSFAWQKLSQAQWLGGLMKARMAALRQADGAPAADLTRAALDDMKAALGSLFKAAEGLDYHYLPYQRGRIYQSLYRVTGDPRYQQLYVEGLEQALAYSDVFVDGLHELAEALARNPATRPRAMELRRRIIQFWPDHFVRWYVDPAYELIANKRYQAAARELGWIVDLWADRDPWVLIEAALAHLRAGDRDRALELIRQLRERDLPTYHGAGGHLLEPLLLGQWAQAYEALASIMPPDAPSRAEMKVVEHELQRRLGRTTEPSRYPPPEGVAADAWQRLVAETRPMVLLHLFNDPERAEQALRDRLALPGPPPAVDFWLEAIYIARARGNAELGREALERAAALDPRHPALLALRSTPDEEP
ncbi:MAG TPA: O-antigen ligase family protein [Candidatus Sumerlaeota bacterium]|nr:O-antigen ligase family protein [Candidatus Sumerlaeota bacterium]